MNKTIFYLVLLLMPNLVFCQNFITKKSVDWEKYEKSYSKEYKLGEIKQIKDDLLEYLEVSKNFNDNFNNFHFIDYNLDGNIDIVYTGDAGTETKRTLIFEKIDNSYHKTFDKFGSLISLYTSTNGLTPYSFILKENACCGGFSVIYEVFHPVYSNDRLKLQASAKYSSTSDTEIPATFFDVPVLFEIKNELYYLRLNPVIDNETDNEELHINGNIIAEYTTGAKGYAVAKKQDDTGRVWWFVFMLNNAPPLKSIFDTGNNNENKYYSIGWMSSRYLKIIE